jgi:uncharacterized membrane protein YccC
MGAVEDTRKVIQDFIAPELREIKARLDALDKRFDDSAKHVDQRFEQVSQRFEQAEKRADERQQALMFSLNSLANYNEVRDRLLRLELEGARNAKQAKESAHQ